MSTGRNWTHLIRFIAKEDGREHHGQIDPSTCPDVGTAHLGGQRIAARVVDGGPFDGTVTNRVLHVDRLLCPLIESEVPIIRCLGLNYRDHAAEAGLDVPKVPVLFMKPRTSLNGPFPATINLPKINQDGTSDYEAELTIVIGKSGKDIPKERALEHVLGYCNGNDVSCRTQQFAQSQWCFSKGFDGAAPIGPMLVAPSVIKDPHALSIKAELNGKTVQESTTKEMIFGVAEMIAFLSQGTTLERGTLIMTGTPPGVGAMRSPKLNLKHGDEMRVAIEGLGTLVNRVVNEDEEGGEGARL